MNLILDKKTISILILASMIFITACSGGGVGPAGTTHEHAEFSVIIDGEEIDFSQQQYQMRADKIHFENRKGDEIHKHARGTNIKYTLQTLGMDLTQNCLITVDGTRHCTDNGNLKITADGEEINNPSEYVISEGENVRITYQSNQ